MVDHGAGLTSGSASHGAPAIPRPPRSLHRLKRPALSQLLDDATLRPLTLVVSPPGTGKTATLAAWVDGTTATAHWLSFEDVRDNHREIVLAFLDSVASMYPQVGQRAFTVFDETQSLEDAIRPLIDDLAAVERSSDTSVVLVVDDLHRVDHDVDLLRALTLLVSHLPDWLRIILASRREPPLPLDRLRARGLVGEVRYPEVRLSELESFELLSRDAPSMSGDDARSAVTKADGWAAYLQMAATSSRSAGARSDSGRKPADPDELIEDYVWHEILDEEPAELVRQLSVLAVAPRANASLAAHLLDEPRGSQILAEAERRGLFVHRVEGRWYEMHPLVREVLRDELVRREPAEFDRARRRLAQWYEDQGDALAALDQWMAAEQPGEVLRLLALNHAELYDTGQEGAVAAILASIPDHTIAADPQALLDLAWCHLLIDRRRFVELVERATWWCDHEPFEARVAARLTILRAMAATMQGNHARGGELARDALARFGQQWWGDPLGRFGWNMVAREVALAGRWDDDSEEVHRLDLELGRDPGRRLAFEGTRALGLALSGHPVDALRIAAGIRRAAEVANLTILRHELSLAEAVALREIGDRQRALRQLEDIATAHAETMLLCRVIASVELVHAHIDRGDRYAARAALQRAQQLIDAESFLPDGNEWLMVAAVRLALADGDADLAGQRAETLRDPFWGPVSMARVHLAIGDADAAQSRLGATRPQGARQSLVHSILSSLAADTADDASLWATTAVEVAVTNGMLQTVAAEGIETIVHLEQSTWPASEDWFERARRSAADVRERRPAVRIDLIEPLTEREWDVIRYLPSRLTVREIAAELYVSVNTLKSHMKAVYRKLGVSSRQEAAGVARTMLAARRHASSPQGGTRTSLR